MHSWSLPPFILTVGGVIQQHMLFCGGIAATKEGSVSHLGTFKGPLALYNQELLLFVRSFTIF